jgi:hypothetical protein
MALGGIYIIECVMAEMGKDKEVGGHNLVKGNVKDRPQ